MSEAASPLTVPKEFICPPGTWNLNVWMLISAFALVGLAAVGHFAWHWWGPLVFGMNVLALHLAGTVIHDASHHAAHPQRGWNAVMGHASALLLGFSFPVFTRVHMQHHAHVNDPENDPDHFVSTGGPLWMIAARFFYHEIFFFKRRLWRKYELLEWFLGRLAVAVIVFAAVQFDFLGYIFNFWFTPALVVGIALGLFFDYLPHRPFQERDRWKNARVYPGRLLNVLIMGQNYHLIHHLWPSIPWYRYQSAYYATQHILDAKGSPQTLGLLQPKDFLGFLYDLVVGIRLSHGHTQSNGTAKPEAERELATGSTSLEAKPKLDTSQPSMGTPTVMMNDLSPSLGTESTRIDSHPVAQTVAFLEERSRVPIAIPSGMVAALSTGSCREGAESIEHEPTIR